MTVAGAGIHKAVATLWSSGGLNTVFQSYWNSADRSLYLSLNDKEAAPGTPYPYCVYTADKSSPRARMSAEGRKKWVVGDQPWRFDVYAQQTDDLTAKELASAMAEEILKVFGGHPTQTPTALTLDHGSVLAAQYLDDYGMRVGDDVHQWTIEYNLRVDSPVMV